MVYEKLLYSRKFLGLMLLILYLSIAYTIVNFNYEGIITGTIVVIVVFIYLTYYAHVHRSRNEILALSTFISLSIILGVFTGTIFTGLTNVGALLYSITLTVAVLLLFLGINRLYRI